MEFLTKYLYLLGSLLGCLIFLIIYLNRKDLRGKMLKVGMGVGIVGIFSEAVFFQDYWIPPLLFRFGRFGGIEDFLFGFAAGGIGSVIYDVFFHKQLRIKNNPHFWIISLLILSEMLAIFVFFGLLKMNSIYASAIGLITPAILIVCVRKDLFKETVFSAILAGGILILVESFLLLITPSYLNSYFLLHGKINLILGLAPVTELIWGMAFGAVIGPLYDFDYGEGPVPMSKPQRPKQTI